MKKKLLGYFLVPKGVLVNQLLQLYLALKNLGCSFFQLMKKKPESDGSNLKPILKYDIQCMSIGFLTDEQTPMIWRGPMVTSTIKTFAQKVSWNNLDFIIVDMPPGTGDTQLTFAQEIEMDGAIIVSTPQELALQDVKRGIRMFDKLGVKIIGLVDNMSFLKEKMEKNIQFLVRVELKELQKNLVKNFYVKFQLIQR